MKGHEIIICVALEDAENPDVGANICRRKEVFEDVSCSVIKTEHGDK